MEVSAKNGENIKELFDSIAKKCPFDGGYSDKNSPILNNNIKIVNKRNCC